MIQQELFRICPFRESPFGSIHQVFSTCRSNSQVLTLKLLHRALVSATSQTRLSAEPTTCDSGKSHRSFIRPMTAPPAPYCARGDPSWARGILQQRHTMATSGISRLIPTAQIWGSPSTKLPAVKTAWISTETGSHPVTDHTLHSSQKQSHYHRSGSELFMNEGE
jgi:hypothetical protein